MEMRDGLDVLAGDCRASATEVARRQSSGTMTVSAASAWDNFIAGAPAQIVVSRSSDRR